MERRAQLRAAAYALGLFGLLAVVAVASRAGRTHGQGTHFSLSGAALDWVATSLLVLGVVALLAFVIARSRGQLKGRAPRKRTSLRRQLLILAVALAVGLVIIWIRRHVHLGLGIANHAGSVRGTGQKPGSAPIPGRTGLRWSAIAVGGCLLLAAMLAYMSFRRPAGLEEGETLADELSAGFELAIDDLERETDARRAVIAAYARAEAVLARHGVPRVPSEAPLEYLGRVLTELRVRADAVLELTDLFERAKYSLHTIDRRMQGDAIAALAAVRDDLAAG